jgi:hypothetical protein
MGKFCMTAVEIPQHMRSTAAIVKYRAQGLIVEDSDSCSGTSSRMPAAGATVIVQYLRKAKLKLCIAELID